LLVVLTVGWVKLEADRALERDDAESRLALGSLAAPVRGVAKGFADGRSRGAEAERGVAEGTDEVLAAKRAKEGVEDLAGSFPLAAGSNAGLARLARGDKPLPLLSLDLLTL
jgi:hypothetical protein